MKNSPSARLQLLAFLAFGFFASILSAQTVKPGIRLPSGESAYAKTVAKLEAGDIDIDYQQFRLDFAESEHYNMLGDIFFKDSYADMYKAYGKEKPKKIIEAAAKVLSMDYTEMRALKGLADAYKMLGDSAMYKKYKEIELGLLRSIVRSGDAKTCETGWSVIKVDEEYFILEMIGADVQSQSLVEGENGKKCDLMKVKVDGEEKEFYFDVSIVFKGYSKMFKEEGKK